MTPPLDVYAPARALSATPAGALAVPLLVGAQHPDTSGAPVVRALPSFGNTATYAVTDATGCVVAQVTTTADLTDADRQMLAAHLIAWQRRREPAADPRHGLSLVRGEPAPRRGRPGRRTASPPRGPRA